MKDDHIAVLLEEYKIVARDLDNAVAYRYQILKLMLVAAGAISTAWVYGIPGRVFFALLMPFVSFTVTILVLREYAVGKMRVIYIYEILRKQVADRLGLCPIPADTHFMEWNKWMETQWKCRGSKRRVFYRILAPADYFAPFMLSAFCLVLAMIDRGSWGDWGLLLFVPGASLTFIGPVLVLWWEAERPVHQLLQSFMCHIMRRFHSATCSCSDSIPKLKKAAIDFKRRIRPV